LEIRTRFLLAFFVIFTPSTILKQRGQTPASLRENTPFGIVSRGDGVAERIGYRSLTAKRVVGVGRFVAKRVDGLRDAALRVVDDLRAAAASVGLR